MGRVIHAGREFPIKYSTYSTPLGKSRKHRDETQLSLNGELGDCALTAE
jgi:hypothetical protein